MRFLLPVLLFGCVIPFALIGSSSPEAAGESVVADPGAEACDLTVEGDSGKQLPPERKNLKRMVANCKKCHAATHAEWSSTQHAKSWSDPVFQAEIKDLDEAAKDSCARCHAPRALWHADEMGEIPVARKLDRDLGVNCVTCHMLGNVYFGPFTSQGHGGVDAEPEYRKSNMCFSCHGQPEVRKEHDQMTSYLEGPAWTKDGKSCQTCHMPVVERKLVTKKSLKAKFLIGVQPVRMHSFTGARHGQIVKGCAKVSAVYEGDKLIASITPETGHSLPCTTHREVVLTVTQLGGDGAVLGEDTRTYTFLGGNALPPGETTTVELAAKTGAKKATVTLVQVLTKCEGRDEAIRQPIHEAETTR